MSDRMFPALLKYWRNHRGHSQLSLAMAADVSARHLSFLESGRAKPSEEMVHRLMSALGVPLRDHNEALSLAGYALRFREPDLHAISPAVDWAIARMLAQQEPYPLTVLASDYRIIKANAAAARIFKLFLAEPTAWTESADMFSLVFSPEMARPFIADWTRVAQHMLARLHLEVLQRSGDAKLSKLLDRVLQYPGVSKKWRQPDFGTDLSSTLEVRLCRGDLALGFMTTMTSFAAPRLVTLEETRIESYFPLDAATQDLCQRLAVPDYASPTHLNLT
jgi:transcriptional regulator with XRE-family HTH domain